MLVFWKARIVLLSVPKTATSALIAAYGNQADMVVRDPPDLKHAPVYRYNRFFRPMFERMGAENMTLAAVVREPIDWLGSWYRYRKRGFLDGKPTSTRDVSFDAFCDAYTRGDRPAFADIGSQSKFVAPRPNGVGVTELFRYEQLPLLQDYLADRTGLRPDLPVTNTSPPADLTLSTATERRLRRRAADDFALWDRAAR